ncbi:MAG: maleylpyruvate isomerase family mycothiol-dependent enzyme [Acidimicrobiales bacterium]
MEPAPSPSITHLEMTWRSIDELCAPLSVEEWARPTGCPGWTVQDNVSHLIDYEATALGWPRPDHVPRHLAHTKNALGESTEVGVDHRRGRTGAEVLEEFRVVTAARRAQLQDLTEADLAGAITTPAGPGTVADMLTLRVMDTWSHEQDMRRALGRPGHEEGPAAAEAITHFARFLPYVVGRRAAAPDGATVVLQIGALHRSVIEVRDGRASPVGREPERATVVLSLPPATFAALVGGRTDAPDDVVIDGDVTLGVAIVAHLASCPEHWPHGRNRVRARGGLVRSHQRAGGRLAQQGRPRHARAGATRSSSTADPAPRTIPPTSSWTTRS